MQSNFSGVAIAIILAGVFIAGAIYFTGNNDQNKVVDNTGQTTSVINSIETASGDISVVNSTDHIRGNPNASIVIIEYLDYNCPHCRNFHQTMNRVMDTYGVAGGVAWVARHLPLKDLYTNSTRLAGGAECVAELAGNAAFWKFSDLLFSNRGASEPADITRLGEFVETAGVDRADFDNCLNANTFEARVEMQLAEAIADGAEGTPYIILIAGNQKEVINGTPDYQTMANIIDVLLRQLEGQTVG